MNFSTKPNSLVYVITLLVYAELYNCAMLERSKKDVLKPVNEQHCNEIFNTHFVNDSKTLLRRSFPERALSLCILCSLQLAIHLVKQSSKV